MGCGGTKTEMSKKEIIEWIRKEKAKFSEEYNKEEKMESDKMMQTLQKGLNKAEDPLAEKLKAIGEMQKNIEEHLFQKDYLEQFAEFELTLERSEYNNLNLCQDIFNDFLKLKQSREFLNSPAVIERFRKYVNENDKNISRTVIPVTNEPNNINQPAADNNLVRVN
jgi:hypothetical protein